MLNIKEFKYISLFSGIGGFESALNNLNGKCVMASEIDKYAEQSYQALYGHATIGDITKVNELDVPDHDILVGGFPCQAFSVAGKRRGFEDARGTLFFEALRIAKHKQPKAILLENVKGLISHDKGQTLDVMISSLSEIGYTVDFDVLNSKYFGVPQNRERIFIVGVRNDLVEARPWNMDGTTIVPKAKRRLTQIDEIKTFNFNFPKQSEVTTKLRDILESNVDEHYYLSEEKTQKLVTQLTRETKDGFHAYRDDEKKSSIQGTHVTYLDGNTHALVSAHVPMTVEGLPIREATKQGYAIAYEGDAVNFQFPESNTRRGRVGRQIANTLEASSINQGVVESRVQILGNVNPSGNGMNGNVYDVDGGLSPTLTTNKGEGIKVAEIPKYYIRRLTPLECWRLQGFTDEQFYTAKEAGLSDSQLYKQAGNAVTVNVIEAIGKNLLKYL